MCSIGAVRSRTLMALPSLERVFARAGRSLGPVPLETAARLVAALVAAVAIGKQADGQSAAGEQHVQDVVGGVDRNDPEHIVTVDQTDDGDESVDRSESEGAGAGPSMPARHEQEEGSRGDVDDVVPAVHLEDEEVLTVQGA